MKITIPKPCHENWANMMPEEKGRFCQVCSKSVRNFTTATDLEIMAELSENPNICANFRADQLNRNLSYSFLNSLFAKFAVGFVLTSSGIVSAQTQLKVNSLTKKDVPAQIKGEVAPLSNPKKAPLKNTQQKPFPLGKIAISNDDKTNSQQIRNTGEPLVIKNQPLYIADGKIISDEEFWKLDRNSIQDFKVFKGRDATSKYGRKGKNGVVIVSLKKK